MQFSIIASKGSEIKFSRHPVQAIGRCYSDHFITLNVDLQPL